MGLVIGSVAVLLVNVQFSKAHYIFIQGSSLNWGKIKITHFSILELSFKASFSRRESGPENREQIAKESLFLPYAVGIDSSRTARAARTNAQRITVSSLRRRKNQCIGNTNRRTSGTIKASA
jgi:hypothetical protein